MPNIDIEKIQKSYKKNKNEKIFAQQQKENEKRIKETAAERSFELFLQHIPEFIHGAQKIGIKPTKVYKKYYRPKVYRISGLGLCITKNGTVLLEISHPGFYRGYTYSSINRNLKKAANNGSFYLWLQDIGLIYDEISGYQLRNKQDIERDIVSRLEKALVDLTQEQLK